MGKERKGSMFGKEMQRERKIEGKETRRQGKKRRRRKRNGRSKKVGGGERKGQVGTGERQGKVGKERKGRMLRKVRMDKEREIQEEQRQTPTISIRGDRRRRAKQRLRRCRKSYTLRTEILFESGDRELAPLRPHISSTAQG